MLSACQTLSKRDNKESSVAVDSTTKFSFLLHFYDLNEAAFAYHRHCLERTDNINVNFLSTLEFVADELLAESIKTTPHMAPEDIVKKIVGRRDSIQYTLDLTNMKKGCHTSATEEAKAHYEEFSRYKRAEIIKFINEQTRE